VIITTVFWKIYLYLLLLVCAISYKSNKYCTLDIYWSVVNHWCIYPKRLFERNLFYKIPSVKTGRIAPAKALDPKASLAYSLLTIVNTTLHKRLVWYIRIEIKKESDAEALCENSFHKSLRVGVTGKEYSNASTAGN